MPGIIQERKAKTMKYTEEELKTERREFIKNYINASEATQKVVEGILLKKKLDEICNMPIMKRLDTYITINGISKLALASKLGISEKKLNRILSKGSHEVSCLTYGKICMALGISADLMFLEEGI